MGDARLWQWLDSGGWLINYVWLRERERERERENNEIPNYSNYVYLHIYYSNRVYTITIVIV